MSLPANFQFVNVSTWYKEGYETEMHIFFFYLNLLPFSSELILEYKLYSYILFKSKTAVTSLSNLS